MYATNITAFVQISPTAIIYLLMCIEWYMSVTLLPRSVVLNLVYFIF